MEPSNAPDERGVLLHRFLRLFNLEGLNPALLDRALIHRSYAYEQNLQYDNERLEFLGDSIIAAVTSEYLYEVETDADEGQLSKLRARLVSRQLLGRRAGEMNLGEIMLLGRGERETGGMERWSILGSALEALVGIIYLHQGYESARRFVRRHVILPLMAVLPIHEGSDDFKSVLQEWTQQNMKAVPTYTRLGEEGPDHDKTFHVQVEIAGRVVARGSGPRIKTAENDAASHALDKIRSGEFTPPTPQNSTS